MPTGVFTFAGRYFDSITDTTGKPLPSQAVTVYNAGTTTLATLYTDRTKATTAANPRNTSTLGNLTLFVQPGDYDLATPLSGVLTTFGSITVPPDPADAEPGAGVFQNVVEFGADATGVADSTAAIQAAITAARSTFGAVLFPPGTYKMLSTISLPQDAFGSFYFLGQGSDIASFGRAPEVRIVCPSNAPAFTMASNLKGLTFHGLRFVSSGGGACFTASRSAGMLFEHCSFDSATSGGGIPVQIDDSFWVWFTDCSFIAPNTTTSSCQIRSNFSNTNSPSYLFMFRDCVFGTSGATFLHPNHVTAFLGSMEFDNCSTENAATPMLDILATHTGTDTFSGMSFKNCWHFDTVAGNHALVRINSSTGTFQIQDLTVEGSTGSAANPSVQCKNADVTRSVLFNAVIDHNGNTPLTDTGAAWTNANYTLRKNSGMEVYSTSGDLTSGTQGTTGAILAMGQAGNTFASAAVDYSGFALGPGTGALDVTLTRIAGPRLSVSQAATINVPTGPVIDLFNVQINAANKFRITQNGAVIQASPTAGASSTLFDLNLRPDADTSTPVFILQNSGTQSGNLTNWTDTTGATILASVGPTGGLSVTPVATGITLAKLNAPTGQSVDIFQVQLNAVNQFRVQSTGQVTIGALTVFQNNTQFQGATQTYSDGANLVLGTTTGTKFGTATSQKAGFFNATPVVQQTGTATITDSSTGTSGTTVNDVTATFNQGILNNNFATILNRLNEINTSLRNLGLRS